MPLNQWWTLKSLFGQTYAAAKIHQINHKKREVSRACLSVSLFLRSTRFFFRSSSTLFLYPVDALRRTNLNRFENKLILLRMFYILSADLQNKIVVAVCFYPFFFLLFLLNTDAVCILSSCKCFIAQKRNIKLKNALDFCYYSTANCKISAHSSVVFAACCISQ